MSILPLLMKTQHVALGPTTFTHSGKVSSYRRLCVAAQEHKGLTVGDILSNSCVQAQGAGQPPTGSKRPTHEGQHPHDSPLCLAAPFIQRQHALKACAGCMKSIKTHTNTAIKERSNPLSCSLSLSLALSLSLSSHCLLFPSQGECLPFCWCGGALRMTIPPSTYWQCLSDHGRSKHIL
jgi:hypothetical protein